MWEFFLVNVKKRRQKVVSEIAKRKRSDEYYADRQRAVIIQLIIVFGAGIAALQLFQLGGFWRILIWPMIILESIAIITLIREATYNQKALPHRIRLERLRKSPSRSRGRKVGSPSAAAAQRSEGLQRPEPS
jgi:hypothetical protein